jgi:fermentation-respiration switch protein FrsA (DUF1100 family)
MRADLPRARRRLLVLVLALSVLAGIAIVTFAEYQGSRGGLHARAGRLAGAEVTAAGVDRRRLFLVGASLGAPAVTIAGAIDDQPAAVIALYGGGPVGLLVTRTLQHRDQRHPYPRWQAPVLGHALAWLLTPLDPVRYAGDIAPRPYLMVNGDDDTLIPPPNVQAVFAAAHEPKTLVWIESEHIQPDENTLISRLATQITDWLATRGPLPEVAPLPLVLP